MCTTRDPQEHRAPTTVLVNLLELFSRTECAAQSAVGAVTEDMTREKREMNNVSFNKVHMPFFLVL